MNKNNLKKKKKKRNQLDSITDEPVHRGALDIRYYVIVLDWRE
jgi:hypothetical protein